jgi:hypothetical protein
MWLTLCARSAAMFAVAVLLFALGDVDARTCAYLTWLFVAAAFMRDDPPKAPLNALALRIPWARALGAAAQRPLAEARARL